MSVIILLPIELATGFLSKSAGFLARQFNNVTHFGSPANPLKVAMDPIVGFVKSLCAKLPGYWGAVIMALAGGIILFVSLWLLTKVLKSLMLGKVEGVLGKYLDRHGPVGILIGAGTTAAGLRAGVPNIIIPFMGDQTFWGRRVYDLGVGTEPVRRKGLTAETLPERINQALSNQNMIREASLLGEKIREENGVEEAVQIITRYIGIK